MISFFANHRTAANLLLTLMIVCGLVAITKINRQFFPDFGIDIVAVTVPWPGASASDIERNIVQAVEPELRFLNGVKKLTSSSYEGTASVIIEFQPGYDMQEALSDIESAIAQVTTLPEEAEKPIIKRLVRYETVSRWVLSGKYPEQGLKEYATKIRDELLDRGIDLRFGRGKFSLSQARVIERAHNDFVSTPSNSTVATVLKHLSQARKTEAYCLSQEGNLEGKLSIIHLIKADKDQAVREIMDRRPLRLKSDQNMLEAIEVASGFVGETIPVIEEPSGKMIGVVSESDLFSAYLEIQEQVQDVEK